MNIEQAVLNNLRSLPREKQQEVLDFTEFLKQKSQPLTEKMTPEQQALSWKQWAESQAKDSPNLPEEALKRETIYD